jgi:hypothetical protein
LQTLVTRALVTRALVTRALVTRALAAGGQQAADLRIVHAWLVDLAHSLAPDALAAPRRRDGATVRQEVERLLEALPSRFRTGRVPTWLQEKASYVSTVLRRLGAGLYQCYDVPDLPRTNNDLEPFSRQLKAGERRATGHRRSDAFVVRVGGFAADAVAAHTGSEAQLLLRSAAAAPKRSCARSWRPSPPPATRTAARPCGPRKHARPRCTASTSSLRATSATLKPAGSRPPLLLDASITAAVFPPPLRPPERPPRMRRQARQGRQRPEAEPPATHRRAG